MLFLTTFPLPPNPLDQTVCCHSPTPIVLRTEFPTEMMNTNSSRPPLPSIEEIKTNLCVPKDQALFYCDPGSYASKGMQWAKRKNNGCKTLSQLLTNKRYPDALQYSMHSYDDVFGLAMAELSGGVAHNAPIRHLGHRLVVQECVEVDRVAESLPGSNASCPSES